MTRKKHIKMCFSLCYTWNKDIRANSPKAAKSIADKELKQAMINAGDVEILQASTNFSPNHEEKMDKVSEMAINIQKDLGKIPFKRLVRLSVSKGRRDEVEVRLAIDKLIQNGQLALIKPGILTWKADV